jgi:chemotaxis protein MotB
MGMNEPEEQAGIPEWVVTFGDMMSLLLTFFILLFSMSEPKVEESKAMMESIRRSFGHDTTLVSIMPGPAPPTNSQLAKLASMGRAQRANTMNGGDKVKAPVGDNARVRSIRPSEETSVGGVIQFPEGACDLTEVDKQSLISIASIIGGKPQKIAVRGHTTFRPLSSDSPYRDKMDLAYARCFKVRDFLVSQGIDIKRFRLEQAGSYEPAHIGHEPDKVRRNARVEVLLLAELTKEFEGTKDERADRFTEGAP